MAPWVALLVFGSVTSEQRLLDSLVDLTNGERAKAQAKRLEWDVDAARIAQAHADDMAARGFFDHKTPDGSTLADRVSSGGLCLYRVVGENLGMGSRRPETMVKLWMESGGHRRNILDRRFTHIGVGFSTGSQGNQSVWCVLFVAR
jgi:uncharacterized protein YkwD